MSMNKDCDLYGRNGICKKYRRSEKCNPSTVEIFKSNTDEYEFIETSEICRKSSIFGNYFIKLGLKDISRLLKGEVISLVDEYGIFIGFYDENIVGE